MKLVAASPTGLGNAGGWKDAGLAGTGVEEKPKEMAEGQTQKQWEEGG